MKYREFSRKNLLETMLDEVSMAPGSLQKWANSPYTEGMMMGIEFEMIVPIDDAKQKMSSFYEERRPDYSLDARPVDITHVIDFLSGELHNQPNEAFTNDKKEKIMTSLTTAYNGWRNKQLSGMSDSLSNEAKKQLVSEYTWFKSTGVTMKDIAELFIVRWPYWTAGSNTDEVTTIDVMSYIGSQFSKHLGGVKFDAIDEYHGIKNRNSGKWIIETDSSIDAWGQDVLGLEFVSPAQPLNKTLEQLHQLVEWAHSYGCKTDKSTGLHMNISVPNFSIEKLDYVKLALFIGDKYILNQFQRLSNTYCTSAINLIKAKLNSYTGKDVALQVLDQMRNNLNVGASKIVHNGITNKYTSINTKMKYVEFRGPGGDYLNMPIDNLISTALRLAMSLNIACDENAYKQEYSKKLYKFLEPFTDENPTSDVFVQYAAGIINREQLKMALSNKHKRNTPIDGL